MYDQITCFIKSHSLITPGQTIIIGLSGGPDSIFLLHYLHSISAEWRLTLVAAHLDHEWRESSTIDAALCRNACAELTIPLVEARASEIIINKSYNGSKEELARSKRRAFFEHTAQQYSADAIALAHHADDQEETFFIRLIRGATLSGLIGMKARAGIYIRPLLATQKKDILAYLHEHGIPYATDPTNESDEYLRNAIRKYAIPALKKLDSRFEKNFAKTLDSLHETEEFLQWLTQDTFNTLISGEPEQLKIDQQSFMALDPFLQKRIIMHWLIAERVPFTPSTGLIDEIIRFIVQTKSSSHTLYGKWVIEKKKGLLQISLGSS